VAEPDIAKIAAGRLPREFWFLLKEYKFTLSGRLYAAWKMLVEPNSMAAALVFHAHARLRNHIEQAGK
jgi:hypothetical protein